MFLSVLFEHKAEDKEGKCRDFHCFLLLHNLVSLPSSLSPVSSPSFFLSSLLPPFYILGFRGNLPALLARPISSGFCTFQSVPFCPSEADALNKMTTVICLCHSGPSTDYIVAQKYSARRGGRMCVSAGSNSLFFSIFQRAAFSIKSEVAGLFKTSQRPHPSFTQRSKSVRNKKLTSGLERGGMDILLLDCPSVLFKLFQPSSLHLFSSLPPSLTLNR